MAKRSLVVVESPTKVKTIQKYLDSKYVVKASMGHVRDLPKSKLGVDEKKGFKPEYKVLPAKKKVLDELKKAAEKVDALYIATDPDREGEAIGWHLAQELGISKSKTHRIMFNEITERAVKAAFLHPGKIDTNKVNAQQARRVLDRLVGYKLSPLLWEKIRRGLSAGRVQSVAVRLITEREREIAAFVPVEYWSLHARLKGKNPPDFTATLKEVKGEKADLPNEAETMAVMTALHGAAWTVKSVTRGERRRNPAPPFITSTLQQDASRKLHFSAKKTMMLAQQLYEGVELGEEGAVGLITYMRTDAVRVAAEAQEEARQWVAGRLGREYLPDAPPTYKAKKSAQEAHEAVRPSSVAREPKAVARFLSQGPARPLPDHLGALPGQPDAARGLRHGGRRHRGGRLPLPGPGLDAQVPRLHRGLRRVARGHRRGARGGGGGGGAAPHRRRGAEAPGAGPQAALHPAAAALHRGLAGEDAGGARDRAAVDLRADPRHHPGPRVRAARSGHAVPHRSRHPGHRHARPALPRGDGRRVHRRARGVARQDRGRRRGLGEDGGRLLQAVLARPQGRRQEDGQRQGRHRRGAGVPGVRQAAAREVGALRQVPRVLRATPTASSPRT